MQKQFTFEHTRLLIQHRYREILKFSFLFFSGIFCMIINVIWQDVEYFLLYISCYQQYITHEDGSRTESLYINYNGSFIM